MKISLNVVSRLVATLLSVDVFEFLWARSITVSVLAIEQWRGNTVRDSLGGRRALFLIQLHASISDVVTVNVGLSLLFYAFHGQFNFPMTKRAATRWMAAREAGHKGVKNA